MDPNRPTPPAGSGARHRIHWGPLLKAMLTGALSAITAISIAHINSKSQKKDAVKESVAKSTVVAEASYQTVAPRTDLIADRLQKAEARLAIVEAAQQQQGQLLLADQGFTVKGVATPTQARKKKKAKANLVKQVQQSSAKGLVGVEATPKIAPLPAELPTQPPPPPEAAAKSP